MGGKKRVIVYLYVLVLLVGCSQFSKRTWKDEVDGEGKATPIPQEEGVAAGWTSGEIEMPEEIESTYEAIQGVTNVPGSPVELYSCSKLGLKYAKYTLLESGGWVKEQLEAVREEDKKYFETFYPDPNDESISKYYVLRSVKRGADGSLYALLEGIEIKRVDKEVISDIEIGYDGMIRIGDGWDTVEELKIKGLSRKQKGQDVWVEMLEDYCVLANGNVFARFMDGVNLMFDGETGKEIPISFPFNDIGKGFDIGSYDVYNRDFKDGKLVVRDLATGEELSRKTKLPDPYEVKLYKGTWRVFDNDYGIYLVDVNGVSVAADREAAEFEKLASVEECPEFAEWEPKGLYVTGEDEFFVWFYDEAKALGNGGHGDRLMRYRLE